MNGPPVDPFSGTPAEHWADGAAGITIPAARAHGPYTAAQVRSAYETTRTMASGTPANAYSLATPSGGAGCQNTTGT